LNPAPGQVGFTEGDSPNLRVQLIQFLLMLTQLCQMLPANQSPQMTQEYQQHVAPLPQTVTQGHDLAVHSRQFEFGRYAAYPEPIVPTAPSHKAFRGPCSGLSANAGLARDLPTLTC
jgi:hypothetical protein